MKDSAKEKIVLLLLNNNSKIEGILIRIDKENLKIILEKGKITDADGNVELFEKTEVSKKDIKEIRLIEEKEKKDEIKSVIKPVEKKTEEISSETTKTSFGSIPMNIQEKYQEGNSKYEKNGFFESGCHSILTFFGASLSPS